MSDETPYELWMEKLDYFKAELRALQAKHGVYMHTCGCCGQQYRDAAWEHSYEEL